MSEWKGDNRHRKLFQEVRSKEFRQAGGKRQGARWIADTGGDTEEGINVVCLSYIIKK